MATTFVAYVPRKRMPSVAELNRAMSSRGFRVKLDSESPLESLGGDLPLKVDGETVPVQLAISALQGPEVDAERERLEAAGDADSEKRLTVYKTTDVRFAFSADDANAGWARDTARALALLACGAFENMADGKLLHFGY